jgi:hypothetical protein
MRSGQLDSWPVRVASRFDGQLEAPWACTPVRVQARVPGEAPQDHHDVRAGRVPGLSSWSVSLAGAGSRWRLDGVTDVPILLLDGTGERSGAVKGGVALHIAIGLVARSRKGRG